MPLVVDAHVFNAARRAPDPLSAWLKVKEQYSAAVLKAAARVVMPTNTATSREAHCCIGALLAVR